MDAYDTRIIDLQVALRHELRGGDRMQYSVRHNDSNSITAVIAKPRGWRRNGLELGVAAHA